LGHAKGSQRHRSRWILSSDEKVFGSVFNEDGSLLEWEAVMAKSDKDDGLFGDLTSLLLAHSRQELLSKLETLAKNYPTARDFYNNFLQQAADLLPATSVAETSPEDLPPIQIPHKEAEMAIYCMQCGTQLPGTAMFCLKCGKPVKDTTSTSRTEPRWEYCEIVCIKSGFLGGKSYFAAQASSSKGRYEAARSTKPFDSIETSFGGYVPETQAWGAEKKAQAALNEVMSNLSTDGWELTGEKNRWWEYKYRRREHS
jgi:hypothetical protein